MVIPTMEIGGAERQVSLLLQRLDRRRYEPALACCNYEGELIGEVPADVTVFDLAKRSRWDFPLLVRRLRDVLVHFDPEIVLATLEYGILLVWLARRLGKSSVPIIARKDMIPSRSRIGERMRWPKLWLDRWARNNVQMIIAPSEGILDELRNTITSSGIRLVRIVNAVDLSRVVESTAERKSLQGGRNPVIVAMGRMVAWKGFDLLVQAVGMLGDKHVELRLLGDGPERLELERMSEDLGIGHSVRFLGFQPNPFPWLEGAVLGVLPSRFEPFGNVIVEMFAAGLPVVAFDVDYGPREVIRDHENGILVKRIDASGLAAAIEAGLSNPDMRARLAECARADARETYDIARVIGRYHECFEDVITQKNSPEDSTSMDVPKRRPMEVRRT